MMDPSEPGAGGEVVAVPTWPMLRVLDLATYGVVLVMGGLGVFALTGPGVRVAAAVLCLAFLIGTWLVASERSGSGWPAGLVFGAQTVVVTALLALGEEGFEAFGFLLLVLAVRVAVVFRPRVTAVWIAVFWLVNGVTALAYDGPSAWFVLAFNAGVHPLCGVFGHVLGELDRARTDGERTLAQLREAMTQLNLAQAQLEELAVAQERTRLSRDLHDSVKQQVFATIMQIGTARAQLAGSGQPAEATLAVAERLAQQAGSELNEVIHQLRADEADLEEQIGAHVADWIRQTAVPVELVVGGGIGALDPDRARTCLRIVQEALANVARHSRAQAVTVRLGTGPDGVAVQVADDGIGFDPDRAPCGVGLASMRSRAEELGGSLDVDSTPGRGTTIDVRLPGGPHA